MKKVILVLDDDENARQAISALLDQDGYKVLEVSNVPSAVNVVRREDIELAIIDIKMPIVDGYKFCEFLRKTNKYSHIPIVIVTGEEKRYGRETAQLLNIEAFIEKPFNPIGLVAKVKEILKK